MEFLIQLKKSTLGGEAMRGGLEAVAGRTGARKFCFGKFFDDFYSHHIDESKRHSDVP
jgi:hypothetical protein